jgi:hypothetical protein
MLADGGEAIADLAVLRGQDELFGPVASASTVWWLLAALLLTRAPDSDLRASLYTAAATCHSSATLLAG